MDEKMMNVNELSSYVNASDWMKTNEYFFDDITGDDWEAFKLSVREQGIIEPVLITQASKRIISGHQRVRAAKELGINEIPVRYADEKVQHIVKGENGQDKYEDDEDKILLCLLETNLKQRGNGNPNPVKMGRCIKELERLYGIQNGNNQYGRVPNNAEGTLTQAGLAERMGMSVDTLGNYKKLAEMPGEVGNAICAGLLTQTTALKGLRKLPLEEQRNVVERLVTLDKERTAEKKKPFTGTEVKKVIDEMHGVENTDNKPVIIDKPESVKTYTEKLPLANLQNVTQESNDPDGEELANLREKLKEAESQRLEAAAQAAKVASENEILKTNYQNIQKQMEMLLKGISDKLQAFGLTFDDDGNIVRMDAEEENPEGVDEQGVFDKEEISEMTPNWMKSRPANEANRLKRIHDNYKLLTPEGRQNIKDAMNGKTVDELDSTDVDVLYKIYMDELKMA